MGATTFVTSSRGNDAKAAFSTAVSEMRYMRGHGGYTGSIAEKSSFVIIRDTIQDVLKRAQAKGHLEDYTVKRLQAAIDYVPKTEKDKPTYYVVAHAIADALLDIGDERVDSKYGPAGCIRIGATDQYVFFGWAAE